MSINFYTNSTGVQTQKYIVLSHYLLQIPQLKKLYLTIDITKKARYNNNVRYQEMGLYD